MRIAYLTNDEVNAHWATEMAAGQGAVLCALLPEDKALEEFDLVIYDWDSLDEDQQQQLLFTLESGPCHSRRVLHSYGLPNDLQRLFRECKVVIHTHLSPEVFCGKRAIRRVTG